MQKIFILLVYIYLGDIMGLGTGAWIEIIVPVILALLIMLLYGFWDKITHKDYYIDNDILAYDEEMIKGEKEGEK